MPTTRPNRPVFGLGLRKRNAALPSRTLLVLHGTGQPATNVLWSKCRTHNYRRLYSRCEHALRTTGAAGDHDYPSIGHHHHHQAFAYFSPSSEQQRNDRKLSRATQQIHVLSWSRLVVATLVGQRWPTVPPAVAAPGHAPRCSSPSTSSPVGPSAAAIHSLRRLGVVRGRGMTLPPLRRLALAGSRGVARIVVHGANGRRPRPRRRSGPRDAADPMGAPACMAGSATASVSVSVSVSSPEHACRDSRVPLPLFPTPPPSSPSSLPFHLPSTLPCHLSPRLFLPPLPSSLPFHSVLSALLLLHVVRDGPCPPASVVPHATCRPATFLTSSRRWSRRCSDSEPCTLQWHARFVGERPARCRSDAMSTAFRDQRQQNEETRHGSASQPVRARLHVLSTVPSRPFSPKSALLRSGELLAGYHEMPLQPRRLGHVRCLLASCHRPSRPESNAFRKQPRQLRHDALLPGSFTRHVSIVPTRTGPRQPLRPPVPSCRETCHEAHHQTDTRRKLSPPSHARPFPPPQEDRVDALAG
ncbi:hypothetical protein RJ55_02782 [Drechmeria coniospora]|nr:hypothetical protein RJ55_02782 [Drechmeria coniospora]